MWLFSKFDHTDFWGCVRRGPLQSQNKDVGNLSKALICPLESLVFGNGRQSFLLFWGGTTKTLAYILIHAQSYLKPRQLPDCRHRYGQRDENGKAISRTHLSSWTMMSLKAWERRFSWRMPVETSSKSQSSCLPGQKETGKGEEWIGPSIKSTFLCLQFVPPLFTTGQYAKHIHDSFADYITTKYRHSHWISGGDSAIFFFKLKLLFIYILKLDFKPE